MRRSASSPRHDLDPRRAAPGARRGLARRLLEHRIDGRTTYTSPRWTDITGQPVGDALGFGWRDVVHPDDRELVARAWSDWHPDQEDARNIEYRIVRPDGSVHHIVDANRRVHDADGQLVGYAGASMDVTEKRSDGERLGRIADRNAVLAALGRRALKHGTSLDDLLRAAVAAVAAALDADFASVGRLTDDHQHHELIALYVRDVGEVPTGQRIPIGRYSQAGLAMVAARARRHRGRRVRGPLRHDAARRARRPRQHRRADPAGGRRVRLPRGALPAAACDR